MKKSNGFTLRKIGIIIVIICIFIIITIRIIVDTYNIYKLQKFVSELQAMQEKVNIIREEYKVWKDYNPNETGNFNTYLQELGFVNANSTSNLYIKDFENIINNLNSRNLSFWNEKIDSIITNYYYFTPQNINNIFEINTDLYVIINFNTGNIISKNGLKDINKNEIIYRQYDSSIGNELEINDIYINSIIPQIEVIENKGLVQKIKIYFDELEVSAISEVYYYTSDTDEIAKKCSSLNEYEYMQSENAVYFNVNISGEYKFIVEDVNGVQYPVIEKNIELCNPPILLAGMTPIYWNGDEEKEAEDIDDPNWYNYTIEELKMANAKSEDGNYWVWVPRFSYNESKDVDINFISENSITSTTNKSQSGYKIHEAFSENSNIMGFWVLKFQSSDEKILLNRTGKPLAVINKLKAEKICNEYIKDSNLKSMIMTTNKLNSIFMYSNSGNIKISNNLIHYSGGGPKELDYIENTEYSSTGNIYGVYDLVTSENELLKESGINEDGRFRAVIEIYE